MVKRSLEERRWNYAALLLGVAVMSAIWGILALYATLTQGSYLWDYLIRQVFWLLIGWGAAAGLWWVGFERLWRDWWRWGLAVWLLIAALWRFGVTVNGMRGWYDCGWFFIQPSELAKPFFLLALAAWIVQTPGEWRKVAGGVGLLGLFGGLIAVQPDFGTLAIYAGATAAALFLGGVRWRTLGSLALTVGVGLAGVMMRYEYVGRRFWAFFNPEADLSGVGWHAYQAQLAIARGGLSGTGLGDAWWSNHYLPLAANDSVFAAVAETLGLFGASAVVLLWGVLLLLGYECGKCAATPERRMMIWLGTATLGIQALLHMGVNTGVLPVTGLPLPFYSYGGSSQVASWMLFGMLFAAAGFPVERKKVKK